MIYIFEASFSQILYCTIYCWSRDIQRVCLFLFPIYSLL